MSTPWRCPHCGNPFDGAYLLRSEEAFLAHAAALGVPVAGPSTGVCGGCPGFFCLTADKSGVRPLTPAERFAFEVQSPTAAGAAAAGLLNRAGPASYVVPVE